MPLRKQGAGAGIEGFFFSFALKGQNRVAQGNALGKMNNMYFYALKGQNKKRGNTGGLAL